MPQLDWPAARAAMMLDPTVANLNTGSFGPLPRMVFVAVTKLRQGLAEEVLRRLSDANAVTQEGLKPDDVKARKGWTHFRLAKSFAQKNDKANVLKNVQAALEDFSQWALAQDQSTINNAGLFDAVAQSLLAGLGGLCATL